MTCEFSITLVHNNLFSASFSLHRDLHSFPTRRSSDLLVLGTSSLGSGTLDITASGAISQTGAITKSSGGTTTLTDSKSTRLNTSHVANTNTVSFTITKTLGNVRDFSLTNSNASAALPT